MASPMSMGGGQMGGWNANGDNQPLFPGSDFQDSGLQVRSMGLKVHYTFDKDGKVNCLARYPQSIQVQTVPIDETNTIGVLDLRICIQAVVECSPELASQDGDYTIYALDYSEPDTPLVGQGMLSWAVETLGADMGNREPKMVTGRVTKNLLGVFGGGNRETLEVKLKFTSAAKVHRPDGSRGTDMQSRPIESATTPSAMTPTGASEWNTFIHNNPQIGQPTNHQRGASPALSHASHGPPMLQHRDSFGQASQQAMQSQEFQRIAPVPVDPQAAPTAQGPSSRPSSRTSNRAPRRKPPTGRPRGRPRKRPLEGNTSGYEDGTEGEDGPAKKRVTTTKVDKTNSNPFGTDPESLRVAASISGSLRSFRPIGMSQEIAAAGSHLQEVPRAPTPVPDGPFGGIPGRPSNMNKPRRGSMMSQELAPKQPAQYPESRLPSFQEDGRSPESAAPTPTYSEDSPADIGSSPPVARTTPFIRSSPPPSSPILPPMPQASLPHAQLPHDLSFMNTDIDELFADEALQAALRDTMPLYIPPRNHIAARTDSSGVPMRVFEMQDGPEGQNMVHIRNYNTPYPTSTPVAPPENAAYLRNYNTPHPTSTPAGPPENVSLPPLPPPAHPKQEPARPKAKRPSVSRKNTTTSPPALAPTPPPTTDAVEKPNSPMAPPQLPQEPAAVSSGMDLVSEPAQGVLVTENPAQGDASAAGISAPPKPKRPRPKRKPRQLNRSQSAGTLDLPTVSASEPAGPSSLSQTTTAEQGPANAVIPAPLKRSASTGPLVRPTSAGGAAVAGPRLLPKPAKDLAVDTAAPLSAGNFVEDSALVASDSAAVSATSPRGLVLPEPVCPPSDALPPAPSSPGESRSNKNIVKKNAIRQRLEAAIMKGEMPPFCNNCGAIETPTWRKIWVKDCEGVPEKIDFSEKPGKVTAIEILTRDAENNPSTYRLIKKTIGPDDDTDLWRELLLCNPCGIWLAKSKCHRPQDRWEKDAYRRGQERRKRSSTGSSNPRPKKTKTKGDSQMNPTSEAYLPTDALCSVEPSSPQLADSGSQLFNIERPGSQESRDSESRAPSAAREQSLNVDRPESKSSENSHGDGTAKSPIDVELDAALGSTKRLLFPSPRKEGVSIALGELSVNLVRTTECRQQKEMATEKENVEQATNDFDDLENLFQSPAIARPCTPPPKPKSGLQAEPFKTPNRPTPSHRPITRSVTKSIKSIRSLKSPIRFGLESPIQSRSITDSAKRRRSPRNHESDFGNHDLLQGHDSAGSASRYFDGDEGEVSPITREIMELLERGDTGFAPKRTGDADSLTAVEEAHAQAWFNLYKSPERNAALEKPSSAEKQLSASMDSWYTGSMENWDQWMKDHGPDITNYHD